MRRHSCFLLAILVFALLLRIWGILFGLPDLLRYDEISYVETALRFGSAFNFNPHCFTHGSLLNYVLFFEYAAVYIVLFLLRLVSSSTDFLIKYYIANPTLLVLVGRITQVLFGVGTVAVTYLIGKALFNKRTGLISAYLLSISFLHIQLSHYIKADILSCFLLTLGFLFVAKVFKIRQAKFSEYPRESETKFFILAGLFIGLAISAKYYAVSGYIFLVSLQILSKSNQKQHRFCYLLKNSIFDRKFLIASSMIIVGFLIGQPYALLAKGEFIAGITSLADIDRLGRAVGQSKLLFYFGDMLKNSIGLPVLICSSLSIYLLTKKELFKKILLLLSLPVAFIIVITNSHATVDRYIIPIVPFLPILSAISINYFLDRFSRYNKKNLLLIAIIVLMSMPLINVIRFSMLISSNDTRTIAKAWIENNIPSNARLVLEGAAGHGEPLIFWGPILKPNLETLIDDYRSTIAQGGKGNLVQQRIKYLKDNPQQITYRLYKKGYLMEKDLESIQPDYVILCGYYDFLSPCTGYAREHQLLYKKIEDKYKRIKVFVPFPKLRWDYHFQMDYDNFRKIKLFDRNQRVISGPTIYIYKKI